jgi:alkylmercury lyase
MNLHDFHEFVRQFMPRLDDDEKRIALGIYRGIAHSGKVSPQELAKSTRIPPSRVGNIVSSWPGVYRDEARDIIGFWGLTAQPVSRHILEIDGRVRYAWCAWDCLFLPEILGETLRVRSTCPQTDGEITLTVRPTSIVHVHPESTVLSILIPDVASCERDVVSHFCHFVHFFSDEPSARKWTSTRERTHVMSLEQGMRLARMKNEWQFGETGSRSSTPGVRVEAGRPNGRP